MRKLPFDDPGLDVPGSWRRSSGISFVHRTCTRLRRATLPLSPSQRTCPDPPRPMRAGAGDGLGDGPGDGLGDGAGWGLSWASSAAETPARARTATSAVQRAARARRGTDVI